MFPLSRTLDTIGPMAHTVEDCVLIDMALRGQSSTPVRPIDLSGVEFVVPDKTGIDDAEAAVAANLEAALKQLAGAGAEVRVKADSRDWRNARSLRPIRLDGRDRGLCRTSRDL